MGLEDPRLAALPRGLCLFNNDWEGFAPLNARRLVAVLDSTALDSRSSSIVDVDHFPRTEGDGRQHEPDSGSAFTLNLFPARFGFMDYAVGLSRRGLGLALGLPCRVPRVPFFVFASGRSSCCVPCSGSPWRESPCRPSRTVLRADSWALLRVVSGKEGCPVRPCPNGRST